MDAVQPNHPVLKPNQAHSLIEGLNAGKSKTEKRKFGKQRMALSNLSIWEIEFEFNL